MSEQVISGLITGAIIAISTTISYKLLKKDIKKEVQSFLEDFVTPPDDKTPSPLESYALKIGEGLALSMRNSFAGQISGDVRLQKGVDKAIGMDVMDQSGIGGILDVLGMSNVKNMLAKNPATLGMILQRVSPLIGQFINQQKGLSSERHSSW
jgi:hypothetical protein